MCRFVAYRGTPLPIGDLVVQPENSLVHQAAQAMESPTRINADGFGVGWYNLDLHPPPAVFKDVTPAWNDRNLRSLAGKVASDCVLAHVRAARRNDPVSRENCHPFQYRSLLWMHNGDVPGRGRLHQRVTAHIDPELVALINGNTDTELLFALFLSFLEKPFERRFSSTELSGALRRALDQVAAWRRDDRDDRCLALNVCVTDGRVIIATRFAIGAEPPSLHYCVGSRYVCDGGECRIVPPNHSSGRCALIASETLSENGEWEAVVPGQMITVHEDLTIELADLALT